MATDLWAGLRDWPWDETQVPRPLREIPPPEVSSRDAVMFRVPERARLLAARAEAGGWTVRITYARGPRLHARLGTVTKVVESVVVRMTRLPELAFGFWQGGKFDEAWVWHAEHGTRVLGSKELNEYVTT
jgi:hypothetical protein